MLLDGHRWRSTGLKMAHVHASVYKFLCLLFCGHGGDPKGISWELGRKIQDGTWDLAMMPEADIFRVLDTLVTSGRFRSMQANAQCPNLAKLLFILNPKWLPPRSELGMRLETLCLLQPV